MMATHNPSFLENEDIDATEEIPTNTPFTHRKTTTESTYISGSLQSNNNILYVGETSTLTEDEVVSNVMLQTQDIHGMSNNIGDHTALMNVIKGNIGTGLFSMPAVVYRSGLLVGVLGIFGMGVLSTYLMRMLVHIATDMRLRHNLDRSKMDYTETVFQVFKHGPQPLRKYKGKFKHIVNGFLIITQIGFCCVYILFMTQNLQQLLGSIFAASNEFITSAGFTWAIGFMVTLLILPFSLIDNLKHLSVPSLLANLATVIALGFIFIFCFIDLQPWQNLPLATSFSSMLVAFGIVIYAFEAISLILPIENKMRTPENFMPGWGVLNTGMVIIICIYTSLGFFGYLRFGKETPASITYGIPSDVLWSFPVKPLLIFAVFVSYLLQFYIPSHIFGRLMEKIACHNLGNDKQRKWNVIFMRFGLVLMTYVFAMSIPHLDLMISLIGSLSTAMLAIIIPPILDIVHRYQYRRTSEEYFMWHVA
jgi:solute carrier family 36 (proton-coupled amino acid transporter)